MWLRERVGREGGVFPFTPFTVEKWTASRGHGGLVGEF